MFNAILFKGLIRFYMWIKILMYKFALPSGQNYLVFFFWTNQDLHSYLEKHYNDLAVSSRQLNKTWTHRTLEWIRQPRSTSTVKLSSTKVSKLLAREHFFSINSCGEIRYPLAEKCNYTLNSNYLQILIQCHQILKVILKHWKWLFLKH